MTDIQVRGTTDAGMIAIVVALLARESAPGTTTPHGVSAWQRVRRAALARRTRRRPHQAC